MDLLQRKSVHFGEFFGLIEPLPPQEPRKSGLRAAFADAADPKPGYEPVTQG